GYQTLPLGNGIDNHGKHIGFITIADHINLIVGYIHKVTPHSSFNISTRDLLNPAIIHEIPMLLVAPRDKIEEAKKIVTEITDSKYITVITPDKLMDETLEHIK
ncbi:MAG: hypothetical protein BV459_02745, partial [Thermoplasmata archaeon M11B2D]